MPEREKVSKGLECCMKSTWNDPFAECVHCPYNEISIFVQECRAVLSADALALLKEQESVKQNDGSCPNCGWNFENGDLDFSRLDSQKFYCPKCGKAVKWE